MTYNPKTWKDDKVGQTPIKAEDLNHIEQGIANAVEKNTDALLTNVVSRNLLGMNNYSYVIWNLNSGATVTAGKENLKITTSGKAYSGIFGKLCQFANLDENKTYTVSFDAKASVNVNLQYGITSNSRQIAITSQTKRISLQETGKNLKNTNFQFYCLSTVVCTITIENIMIDEGNVATPYTPYLNLQELQEAQAVNALMVGISSTHTTTQTIEKLTLNTINTQIGGNFSVSNGNVLIGKGINVIRISGQILFSDVDTNNKRLVMIIEKNSETVGYSENIGKGLYETINLSNIILKVNEGDIISLKAGSYSSSGLKINNNINKTFITIEKI